MQHIQTMKYYSAVENDDIMKLQMDGTREKKSILSEVSQAQKDKLGILALK